MLRRQPLGLTLIVQMLPWPNGSILAYRYPSMISCPAGARTASTSAKIAFHPGWNFILCNDRQGIHRVPFAALM
jgi:hypothetical protein